MGSTNKTQYLELPQWIGTDQPTWLGDMNDAFLKIDNSYEQLNGEVSGAVSDAGTAEANASEALSKANTANEAASSAKTSAESALTTAQAASAAAQAAQKTADSVTTTAEEANYLATQAQNVAKTASNSVTTLTKNVKTWSDIQITNADGVTGTLNCSYNAALGMLNIYGQLHLPSGAATNAQLFTFGQEIRPLAVRTIRSVFAYDPVNTKVVPLSYTVSQTGVVTIEYGTYPGCTEFPMNLMLNVSDWF